jgi:IclR family acetate operon transcriptional repressor
VQKVRVSRKTPQYPIEAVDNALQLIELLRDHGSVRLKDAAAELGVSPSTAHRLLAMLIYRGFAERARGRGYVPGPALGAGPAGHGRISELRALAQPLLEELAATVRETVNLMVRVGGEVRFLTTIEGSKPVRVGDRQGAVLPAHRASAGKAMLARLDPIELERLYSGEAATARRLDEPEYAALVRELGFVRERGFAANFEGTEEGVSALGMAITNADGDVVCGISVAIPQSRFREVFDAGLLGETARTAKLLEERLSEVAGGAGVDRGQPPSPG